MLVDFLLLFVLSFLLGNFLVSFQPLLIFVSLLPESIFKTFFQLVTSCRRCATFWSSFLSPLLVDYRFVWLSLLILLVFDIFDYIITLFNRKKNMYI